MSQLVTLDLSTVATKHEAPNSEIVSHAKVAPCVRVKGDTGILEMGYKRSVSVSGSFVYIDACRNPIVLRAVKAIDFEKRIIYFHDGIVTKFKLDGPRVWLEFRSIGSIANWVPYASINFV